MQRQDTDASVAAASAASHPYDDAARHSGLNIVVPTEAAPPPPAYAAADSVTIEGADTVPQPSIDEVVSRLVICEDRPIENLPLMTSSELRLIGRCVSLCVKQTIQGVTAPYYYTGLVSMVTDTSVTLMCVSRYTQLDFKFYQSRETRIADFIAMAGFQDEYEEQSAEMGSAGAASPPASPSPQQTTTALREAGEAGEMEGAAGATSAVTEAEQALMAAREKARRENLKKLATYQPDPAGSLGPALCMTLEPAGGVDHRAPPPAAASAAAANASSGQRRTSAIAYPRLPRPPNFRTCAASLGPLPYVTFLRTSIQDVSFGRDPASSFYSLFSDPEKRLLDMQLLRTFVRRYLVHTSEGNNPRQVPLYAFLMVRGGCPNLDRSLADRVVREELPALMKADKAIDKEKKKQQRRSRRGQDTFEEYRAPQGPFANTGVLYLTQIPQQTFMCGLLTMVFTIGFTLYLFISLGTSSDSLITLFVVGMLNYLLPSMMVWTMSGILTLMHATSMRLPLRENLESLIARAAFSVGTVICGVLTLITLTRGVNDERIMKHMYRRRHDSLCSFYEAHQCSGFYTACGEADASYWFCSGCSDIGYLYSPCYMEIWARIQFIILPLLLFTVFVLLSGVNSLMLILKLVLTARSVSFAAM